MSDLVTYQNKVDTVPGLSAGAKVCIKDFLVYLDREYKNINFDDTEEPLEDILRGYVNTLKLSTYGKQDLEEWLWEALDKALPHLTKHKAVSWDEDERDEDRPPSYLEFEIKNFREGMSAFVAVDVVSSGIPRRGSNYWESEAPEFNIDAVYIGDDEETNHVKSLTQKEKEKILEKSEEKFSS